MGPQCAGCCRPRWLGRHALCFTAIFRTCLPIKVIDGIVWDAFVKPSVQQCGLLTSRQCQQMPVTLAYLQAPRTHPTCHQHSCTWNNTPPAINIKFCPFGCNLVMHVYSCHTGCHLYKDTTAAADSMPCKIKQDSYTAGSKQPKCQKSSPVFAAAVFSNKTCATTWYRT